MSPTSGRCPERSSGLRRGANSAVRAVFVTAARIATTIRARAAVRAVFVIAALNATALRAHAAPATSTDSTTARLGASVLRGDSAATIGTLPLTGSPLPVRGALTLERALGLALGAPPAVAQAQLSATAELARAREEATPPDPTADATFENFGPKSEGRAEQTLTWTQPLLWRGRLVARRGVVGALQRGLPLDLEVARRQFARTTGETFVQSWWLEQRVAVLARAEGVDAATIRSSEERTRAGAAPITEALRARTTMAQATIERRHAETDLADARLKLAQSWGARSADFDTLVLPPPSAAPLPSLDTLVAGIDRRPEMRRATSELAIAQARLAVVRSDRAPELSAQGGLRHLDEIDRVLFVAALSARVPFYDRQKNLIAAAQADLQAAQLRERTLRLELERQLVGAWRRCRAAAEDYALARDTALPAAREALVKLEEGYRAGRFRYLDYLDGQHAVLDTELAMLDAAREYWNARLAIEWSPPLDAGTTGP